jgi:hypothetical protein
MKRLLMSGLAAAGLVCAGAANAQTFTGEIEFEDPNFVGGLGPAGTFGRGGTMNGTFTVNPADGPAATGSIRCVGMDQPPSASLFDVHLACDAVTAEEDGRVSIIYGCSWLAEDRQGPLSCVGAIEGKTGPLAGRRGATTLHLRQGTSITTGQWYE